MNEINWVDDATLPVYTQPPLPRPTEERGNGDSVTEGMIPNREPRCAIFVQESKTLNYVSLEEINPILVRSVLQIM